MAELLSDVSDKLVECGKVPVDENTRHYPYPSMFSSSFLLHPEVVSQNPVPTFSGPDQCCDVLRNAPQ